MQDRFLYLSYTRATIWNKPMRNDKGRELGSFSAQARRPAIDLISNLRRLNGRFAAREQKVADFVDANIERIPDMTIAQLAAACTVSAPTVIRFCRTMGCAGYRDFKLRLAQNLAVSQQYLDAEMESTADSSETALDRVLAAFYRTANIVRRQLDPTVFEHAAGALAASDKILAAGIGGGSSMVAWEAANRFFRLGIPAFSVSDSYLMQMRAATLGPRDILLLISASGEAAETVSAAEIANGYGATVICVTRSGTPLVRSASIPIVVDLPEDPDIHKPTASRHAHLLIIDALALAVARMQPERTSENLRRVRASLTAYHSRIDPQPLGD